MINNKVRTELKIVLMETVQYQIVYIFHKAVHTFHVIQHVCLVLFQQKPSTDCDLAGTESGIKK